MLTGVVMTLTCGRFVDICLYKRHDISKRNTLLKPTHLGG